MSERQKQKDSYVDRRAYKARLPLVSTSLDILTFYSAVSDEEFASVSSCGGALFAHRKPSQLFVFVGVSLPRLAACAGEVRVFHEPPRDTRIVLTLVKSSINASISETPAIGFFFGECL
jgi:hypothetical protein